MSKIALSRLEGLPHQIDLWTDKTDDARIAIVGPYGCGKTMALAVKMLISAVDNQGVDSMLVVPTYSMARLIHLKEWPAIWAALGVTVQWRSTDFAWRFSWGDKLWVRSAEKPQRLAGPNLATVAFDEPGQMHSDAWERGSIRPRSPQARYRQNILGGTPEGINWFADKFDDPKPPYRTIRAAGWHQSMPNEHARIRATYGHDESLMAAYARGEFVPLRQGRCFKNFRRAEHVRPTAVDPNLPLVLSCDFNVDSMRWMVEQISSTEIVVLDEISLGQNSTTEQAALEFSNRHNDWRGAVIVTGDVSGNARHTSSGSVDYHTILEVLDDAGFTNVTLNVPTANPLQKERVDTFNYHLSGRGRRVSIDPSCTDLIRDLERVAWKPGTTMTVQIDKRDPTLTHSSDAATYAIWHLARVRRSAPVAMGKAEQSTTAIDDMRF